MKSSESPASLKSTIDEDNHFNKRTVKVFGVLGFIHKNIQFQMHNLNSLSYFYILI